MEEQTKESDVSLKEELEEKLEKISSLAPFCENPPQGWIHAVGEVLGLTQVQLARRLQITQKELFDLEQKDLSRFIPKNLDRLGKALGGRFEYVLIPNQRKLLEEKIGKKASSPENLHLKTLNNLSSLPSKSPEGWINFIRESQEIWPRDFSRKLQIRQSTLMNLEAWEQSNLVIRQNVRKLLSELRYRLEYYFIPEKEHLLNLSPKIDELIHQLEPLDLLPPKQLLECLHTIRKAKGVSQSDLDVKIGKLTQLIMFENKNKLFESFNGISLAEIARALGCQFKYVFVSETHLFDQKTVENFNYPSEFINKSRAGFVTRFKKDFHVNNVDLKKKLGISFYELSRILQKEKHGDIVSEHVTDFIFKLGCQIKYVIVPSDMVQIKKLLPHRAEFWKGIKQASKKTTHPPDGWLKYIRETLNMTPKELALKTGIKESIILQIEQDEKKHKIIKEAFSKLVKLLNCRVEYVIVPSIILNQKDNSAYSVADEDLVYKFEKLSSLPKSPGKGWLNSIVEVNNVSITKLSLKANIKNVTTTYRFLTKGREGKLIHDSVLKTARLLDARVNFIFIPNANMLSELADIRGRIKKIEPRKQGKPPSGPIVQASVSAQDYEHIKCLPEKPARGWVHALRNMAGLTQKELSKLANCLGSTIQWLEQRESRKYVFEKNLQKIADGLGCKFEYYLIPSSIEGVAPISKKLSFVKNQFELSYNLSRLPKKPEEGWIRYFRNQTSITQRDLGAFTGVTTYVIAYYEKRERDNKIIPKKLEEIARFLSCKAEYYFIPKKASISYEPLICELHHFRTRARDINLPAIKKELLIDEAYVQANISAQDYEHIKSLPEKPAGGWIHALRNMAGLTQKDLSELANCLIYSIRFIEQQERRKYGFEKTLQKIADGLECKFEYYLIPFSIEGAASVLKKPSFIKNQFELSYNLSHLPKKPEEGWICYFRNQIRISQRELGAFAGMSNRVIAYYENREKENKIIPKRLENIARSLGYRVEYYFIPKKASISYETLPELDQFRKTRDDIIQPVVKKEFLEELKRLYHFPKRPQQGWVRALREDLKLSQQELAHRFGCRQNIIWKMEKLEKEDKIIYQPLKELAQTLGCRIDYTFIPEKRDVSKINSEKADLIKALKFACSLKQKAQAGQIKKIRLSNVPTPLQIMSHIQKEMSVSPRENLPKPIQNIAKALDCQVKRVFLLKKPFIQNFLKTYETAFQKLDDLSCLPQTPKQGWIRAIRKSLHMTQADFGEKINKSKRFIFYCESLEQLNKCVHPSLQKIAQVLDCKVEHIFIPKKDIIAGIPIEESELLKTLKSLSSVAKPPDQGWINLIKTFLGVSQMRGAWKAKYKHSVSSLEKQEVKGLLIPKSLRKLAKALGGKFEYRLIPNTPLEIIQSFTELQHISSAFCKPTEGWIAAIRKTQRERNLNIPDYILNYYETLERKNLLVSKNQKRLATSLEGQYEYIFVPNKPLNEVLSTYFLIPPIVPLKPSKGWLTSLREAQGMSVNKLAIMSHLSYNQVRKYEEYERKNKFLRSTMHKIAKVLEGRFEYVIIPEHQMLESLLHKSDLMNPD